MSWNAEAQTPPPPLTTLLEEFAALSGLAVLSKHLPILLSTSAASLAALDQLSASGHMTFIKSPAQHSHAAIGAAFGGTSSMASHGNLNGVTEGTFDSWVKLDGGSDELDKEMDEILMAPSSSSAAAGMGATGRGALAPPTPQYVNTKRSRSGALQGSGSSCHALPMHNPAAFSLFLSMPHYAEAVLQDRRRAQMLLRLALGVSDDGQGGNILSCPDAAMFPILPFGALLHQVLDANSAETDAGVPCLAVFTQQVNSTTVTIPSESFLFF